MNRCLGMYCCLISVFVFAVGFYGCSDDKVSKEVASINARLEKIEERLLNIEKSAKKVAFLEKEFQKVQQSMDAWERAITARLAPVNKKKSEPRNSPTEKRTKGKYYVVERGDSLFRIAQKHNMSIERLCELNNISQNEVLHPGTKLLVK